MIRCGFVQAGGGSTRFGTDKALVKLAGRTMLERTGELLAKVCEQVLVIAPPGKYTDLCRPVIADRWPGQGPLGGILTALLHANEFGSSHESQATADASCSLITGCDMPFLTPEFLRFLGERALRSQAQVAVPRSAGGLEPLCACWRSDSLPAVQAAFDAGVRKVGDALKHLSMEVLDESVWKRFDTRNRLFWNMNTPTDYEEARRLLETEAYE